MTACPEPAQHGRVTSARAAVQMTGQDARPADPGAGRAAPSRRELGSEVFFVSHGAPKRNRVPGTVSSRPRP